MIGIIATLGTLVSMVGIYTKLGERSLESKTKASIAKKKKNSLCRLILKIDIYFLVTAKNRHQVKLT